MTELDEKNCPLCKIPYDSQEHTPRILLNCGHTICSTCIQLSISSNTPLKCPEDSTEYSSTLSLSQFPINQSLLKLLTKLKTTRLSLSSLSQYPINALSRDSLLLFKSLKSVQSSCQKTDPNKNSQSCQDHPERKLELICLEDKCKICTNCVIFGSHKSHNVINIDEFIKCLEKDAGNLIELFENITVGNFHKDMEKLNDHDVNKFKKLRELIDNKYENISKNIQEFTEKVIQKLKEDENKLIKGISLQLNNIKERIVYYENLPNEMNDKIKTWERNVQSKMNILNEIKDFSEECLMFVDSNKGSNYYNQLIISGNNIIKELNLLKTFPLEEITKDINNLNINIDNSILNQEFFNINNKLDFSEFFLKYEIPKKDEDFLNKSMVSQNTADINCPKNKNNYPKYISCFSGGKKDKNMGLAKNEIIQKSLSKSGKKYSQIRNETYQGSNTGKRKYNRSKNKMINAEFNLSQDSFLFTDLFRGSLCPQREKYPINLIKDFHLNKMKIPEKGTKDKKCHSFIERNNKSSKKGNNNKSKLLSQQSRVLISGEGSRTPRTSNSPLNPKKYNEIKNLLKKTDKINLSKNDLGNEGILALTENIGKNKDKIKELKLVKCSINDEGCAHLLKVIEGCNKLSTLNLANNLLTEKSVKNIVQFLGKNKSLNSVYFTNNNFSVNSKEKIKASCKGGKIKIFL